jgi:hypothetical protein
MESSILVLIFSVKFLDQSKASPLHIRPGSIRSKFEVKVGFIILLLVLAQIGKNT